MNLQQIAITSAEKAAVKILEIYNDNSYDISIKNDKSPLTDADKASNQILIDDLRKTGLPIISEESKYEDFNLRNKYTSFWMIDPLDGTKEFINRNGEFTINIALIEYGIPVFGVVHCPCLDKLFYGGEKMGAFLKTNQKINQLKNREKTDVSKMVISRSHLNKETIEFIDTIKNVETIKMGSSLKFMSIAEGLADIYPRFGPTMEWDTAASHAILKGLNIEVLDMELNTPLNYNKENLLNPHFIVRR